jgi:hypothetical protein
MTNRDTQLKSYLEYRKALYDLERRKPPGAVYKLFSEKGSEDGKLIYDPDDDSITIKLPGVEAQISGAHLHSLYSALGNLVG